MNRFAELLDRLAYEPGRNNKLRLLTCYFREIEDPDRGYALAALTGALSFKHAKPGTDPRPDRRTHRSGAVRAVVRLRRRPLGDGGADVAVCVPRRFSPPPAQRWGGVGAWGAGCSQITDSQSSAWIDPPPPTCESSPRLAPAPPRAMRVEGGERIVPGHNNPPPPTLTEVVTTLRTLGKTELPRQLARWLDELDETGRWALLKLVTGAMRIGISARLAKTAAAELGDKDPHDSRTDMAGARAALSRSVRMAGRPRRKTRQSRSRPVPAGDAGACDRECGFQPIIDAADYIAEWKWDGIRVQAVSGNDARGHIVARLYSRSGEDITKSFPDLLPSLHLPGAIDGELLVVRDGRVQSFNVLQQRLNRKIVSPKLMKDYPIHLRAYDLLGEGDTDLRTLPFAERRARLEAFVTRLDDPGSISRRRLPSTAGTRCLGAARSRERRCRRRCRRGRRRDAEAPRRALSSGPSQGPVVEMETRSAHHRRRADVRAARPRQALVVLFGLHVRGLDLGRRWRAAGAGRQGLFRFHRRGIAADRSFRPPQHNREIRPGPACRSRTEQGLVLEVAFEGLQRSSRHKSGVAMRFPRINRLRWDKPPREADRLETLERMLKGAVLSGEADTGSR